MIAKALNKGKSLKSFTVYYHELNTKDDGGFVELMAYDKEDAEGAFFEEMSRNKYQIQEIELKN